MCGSTPPLPRWRPSAISTNPPPSRTSGPQRYYRFNTEERKTITISATDPRGRSLTRSVDVYVYNSPPLAFIDQPGDGDTYPTGERKGCGAAVPDQPNCGLVGDVSPTPPKAATLAVLSLTIH